MQFLEGVPIYKKKKMFGPLETSKFDGALAPQVDLRLKISVTKSYYQSQKF
jgi:hypothetical protein